MTRDLNRKIEPAFQSVTQWVCVHRVRPTSLVYGPDEGWVHTNPPVYRPDQWVVHTILVLYRPALLRINPLVQRPEKGLLRKQYLFIACPNCLLYGPKSHVGGGGFNLNREMGGGQFILHREMGGAYLI